MKHLIMDHTGHSTIEIDKDNSVELNEALERFTALIKEGNIAATRKTGETDYKVIKNPADQQDETLFVPQMRGG